MINNVKSNISPIVEHEKLPHTISFIIFEI